MKVRPPNLQVVVSVGTMQLALSIVITQVPTSVAIMQVLRFYCNANMSVLLSATIMLVDLFVAII